MGQKNELTIFKVTQAYHGRIQSKNHLQACFGKEQQSCWCMLCQWFSARMQGNAFQLCFRVWKCGSDMGRRGPEYPSSGFPFMETSCLAQKRTQTTWENTPVHSVSSRFHSFWEEISMAAREDKFEQKSRQVKNRTSWRLVIYLPHLFRCWHLLSHSNASKL